MPHRAERGEREIRKDQHQLEVLPLAEEPDHEPEGTEQEGCDQRVPGTGADGSSAQRGNQRHAAEYDKAAHENTKARNDVKVSDAGREHGQRVKQESERRIQVDQIGIEPSAIEQAPGSVEETRGVPAYRI